MCSIICNPIRVVDNAQITLVSYLINTIFLEVKKYYITFVTSAPMIYL